MRSQPIKRIVDATKTQQRYIIHLTCGHNVTLTERDIAASPHSEEVLATATHWSCQYCPDEKSEDGPSAQQLWREAGEP